MANLRNDQSSSDDSTPAERAPDILELEDGDFTEPGEEGGSVEESKKILFAKSTDIRRRIEEKLEVRVLRDELGVDDLDL